MIRSGLGLGLGLGFGVRVGGITTLKRMPGGMIRSE